MIIRASAIVIAFATCGAPARAQQGLNGVLDITAKPTRAGQVGIQFDIVNAGTKVPTELGYGLRTTYTNTVPGKTIYDIGVAFHSVWQEASSIPGSQMFGGWTIAEGPTDSRSNYGVVGHEFNIVNRGDDTGWTYFRGTLPRFSAILQLVPETNVFTHGGTAQNITASIAIGQSPSAKTDGRHARSYNGVLIEPNAIAAGGRALTFSGDTTSPSESPTATPFAVATILGRWSHGIDTTQAIVFDSVTLKLAMGQKVAWFSEDGQQVAGVYSNEAGDLNLGFGAASSLNLVVGGIVRRVTAGDVNSGGPGLRALTIQN